MTLKGQMAETTLPGPRVTDKKKKDAFITLLRVLACILILNSHCRDIYPLYFLAVGGGQGNAIFFIVSGYCLARIKDPFPRWYRRRLGRILPATFVVLALGMFLDGPAGFCAVPIQEIFLRYLNRYWFVWAILLYYCVFAVVYRKGSLLAGRVALGCYAAIYFLLYLLVVDKTVFSVELEGFSPFKVYFYFGVFLIGGFIRLRVLSASRPEEGEKRTAILSVAVILVSLIVWCGEYALIMVFQTAYFAQFLIHVGVFAFGAATLTLGVCVQHRVRLPKGNAGVFLDKMADSTLEIYLIQVTIKPLVTGFPFPADWVLFIVLSIAAGMALHGCLEFAASRMQLRRRES